MCAPVLEVSNISKRFGGIAAVDGVSFSVREREILGILDRLVTERRSAAASRARAAAAPSMKEAG